MTLPVEQQQKVETILRRFPLIRHFFRKGEWRGEPEQEQALLRIAITTVILAWILLGSPATESSLQLWSLGIQIVLGFLVYSALFLAVTLVWPGPSVLRRVIGVIGDVGITTVALHLTGPIGAPWYGVFLWVTLGNGFRYGEKFLYLSGVASLLGFGTVVLVTPYWEKHADLAIGLVVTLLVIPSYSAILIRRLNEARAQADAANRAKSDFLSRMSHEIRTPLNGILGMTDLLRESELSPEAREYVETIYASGKTLAHQIDEILDLSKIEAGRLSLERVEFDLYALISTTLRIFEPQVTEKQIQLQKLINPKTPFLLYGDPHKLRQIIINLVGNAVKFTDHGFVSLRVHPLEQSDDRVTLRFEVADTGGGIPSDRVAKIFEPFSQANSSVARRHGGTGLGTTICKHLTELMGGEIGVQSTPDLGTTFWFDIPFETTDQGQLSAEGVSWANECNVVCLRASDALDSDITKILQDWKIPFDTANTLEDAGRLINASVAESRVIDALIVDNRSYRVDLEALLSRLYAEQSYGLVPVILIGSEKSAAGLSKSKGDQVFYISRPIDKRVLFNTLHACYSRHSTEDDVIRFGQRENLKLDLSETLNVLIGDDNATNRLVLQRMLEKMGYHSVAVGGGEAVLTALEKNHYDVVIVDKNMPDMSGIDVFTNYMIAHGGQAPTEFVILTADATAESRDSCVAAGIEYFLTKPISLVKLQEVFNRIRTRTNKSALDQRAKHDQANEHRVFPIVDEGEFEKLNILAGDDEKFMSNIIANFENDAKRDVEALEFAVASDNWLAFKDSAHALKGAAMYLGFRQLAALTVEAQAMDREAFRINGGKHVQIIQEAANTAIRTLKDKINTSRKCG